jgi:WD40 repeat protein
MPGVKRLWQAQLPDHVIALAWSPATGQLAAAAVSGPVTVFREDGATDRALAGHEFGTAAVSWHPTEPLLASAGQDGKARLWNGAACVELAGGAAWVERAAWSPSGNLLATAGGKKLRLWDSAGQLVREYPDHPATIAALAWRPLRDRDSLVTGTYGGVFIWKTDADKPQRKLDYQGSIIAVACSPDGRYLVSGNQDSTLKVWQLKSNEELEMTGYATKIRELAWDATGRYLATGGSEVVTVWDCSGKGPRGTQPAMLVAHEQALTALTFQRAGKLLASGSEDGCVAVWRLDKPKAPVWTEQLSAGISQLAWSPDDARLAVGTASGAVEVYHVA